MTIIEYCKVHLINYIITFLFSLFKQAKVLHETVHQFYAKLPLHHADNPNDLIERGGKRKAVIKQAEEMAVVEEEEEAPIPLLSIAVTEEECR